MKYYSYIFVRQDLSIEQQIVQTGHVSMQMGYELGATREFVVAPEDTHFVLVGVRNIVALEGVKDILSAFNYEYEEFVESYPSPQITAVATLPIRQDSRGPLMAFNLLKVEKTTTQ